MRGFKKGSKPSKQKLEGGKVSGPGTGTSDDVKAQVAEGSYIMPADSTEQIGDAALSSMGKQVPVNLSNGEFQMPPEQVHAVGVQALDQMKNATHAPVAQKGKGFTPGAAPAEQPEMFFANGGPVFSGVDPDELGRGNTPNRPVIPKPAPNFYTDSAGNTGRSMPSASREVVPYKGPGTAVATIPQPQPAAAPAPQAPKADFYTNNSGTTGKGFAPSSSTAVTPAGPLTQQPQPAQPQRPALPPPQAQPAPRPEPDYRARAEATARAKRDTAAFQAERAAQDARFEAAKNQPAAPEKTPGRVRPAVNGTTGKGVAALSVIPALAESAAEDSTARYAKRFGMDEPTGDGSAGDIAKFAALRGLGFASDLGNNLTMGLAGNLYRDNQGEQAPAQVAPAATTAAQARTQPASAPVVPAAGGDLPTDTSPRANDITRVGNSFSGTNIGPGFTVNGQAQGATNVMPAAQSPQNKAAVEALFARTPELGQGAPQAAGFQPAGATSQATGARYTVVGGEQDPRNSAEFRAASTPYRGAQNGQLTASQISNMRGIVNDQRTDSTSRANNEANNTALLQREAIGQQGANARTAFTEQGQNSRFDQSNQLDRQRLAGDQEVQGFTTRAAARTEKLYEKYETAKPEERAAIAQQIRDLAGKDGSNNLSNNFMKRKVPAYDDKGQIVGEQEEIVDLRSMGQASSPDGQQGTPPPTNHIEALKNNPSLAAQFEAKYGKGAASRYLGGN